MKMKIGVAEDNYFLAKAMKEKLNPYKDIVIEILATNGVELLEALETNHNLDAIIMDIEMPKMDGIEATEKIKKMYPHINIMMFTVFEDHEKIYQAIQAGANGYLLKEEDGPTIYAALHELKEGGSSMSAKVTKKTIQLLKMGNKVNELSKEREEIKLSTKETEVLQHISKGLNYKEIADNLAISPSTVRKHTENIYKKLDVHNKIEAISKGQALKII